MDIYLLLLLLTVTYNNTNSANDLQQRFNYGGSVFNKKWMRVLAKVPACQFPCNRNRILLIIYEIAVCCLNQFIIVEYD
jgi:hypothetical protein